MNRATKILPKTPEKLPAKITIPVNREELLWGIDQILGARTLRKGFGDVLARFIWVLKMQDKAAQVNFSRAVGKFLDSWGKQ